MVGPAPAIAGESALTCEVEIRLTSITSVRTLDHDETGLEDAPGEYSVRALSAAAIGPFDLRTGDGSSFAPGLRLDAIDTGWSYPRDGETTIAAVAFGILVREDDSNPVGEDDHDDVSAPLLIREHVVCPGGVTNLMRTVDVDHNDADRYGADGRRRRSDQLRLGLQIITLD